MADIIAYYSLSSVMKNEKKTKVKASIIWVCNK